MKKIIFLFTLALAIILISAYRQSEKNGMAEIKAKSAALDDLKMIDKTDVQVLKAGQESLQLGVANEGSPKILFMLHKDTGMTRWSPSLWWSYEHSKTQPGC
jgi:hypothetical protein